MLVLVSAWLATVAVALSAQQPTAPPPGDKSPQQVAFERFQRAERVMNMSCSVTGCHTVRPIQTAAKDAAGWSQTVDAMIEKGAKFEKPEDKDILIEYLVQQHGPLPEGEGRTILLNTCTICHDLQRVRTRRAVRLTLHRDSPTSPTRWRRRAGSGRQARRQLQVLAHPEL